MSQIGEFERTVIVVPRELPFDKPHPEEEPTYEPEPVKSPQEPVPARTAAI